MKLQKPIFDAGQKTYFSAVDSGVRLTSEIEGGVFHPTLEELKVGVVKALIPLLIESTKGWFKKPLTQEWLQTRCEVLLPNPESGFEGKIVWELKTILIKTDKFQFQFEIVEKVANEPLVIALEEPEVDEEEEVESIDPVRRIEAKQKVLKARAKAARALFKAERLTQEYIQRFGEDTDWEDEESGMESS